MSTATIIYAMQGTGNLDGVLDKVSSRLKSVHDNAVKAKNAIGDLVQRQRDRLNTFTESVGTMGQAYGMLKDAVEAVGGALHTVLSKNKEYTNAVGHLTDEVGRLSQSVSDVLGPKVADFIKSFTIGIVYLGNLVPGVLSVAFNFIRDGLKDLAIFSAETVNQLKYVWKQFRSGEVIDLDKIKLDLQGANAQLVIDYQTAVADMMAAQEDAWKAAFEAFKRGNKEIVTSTKQAKTAVAEVKKALDTDVTKGAQASVTAVIDGIETSFATATTEAVANLENMLAQQMAALKQQRIDSASSMVSGLQGGVAGILSVAGGPIGSLVAGILGLVRNAPQVLTDLLNEVLDIYLNTDEIIGAVVGEVFPRFIMMIPTIVSSFVTLGPRIIGELITAMPTIAAAIVDAFVRFIPVFIADLKSALKEFAQDLLHSIQPFRDPGQLFKTSLGPNAEVKRFLGIKLPGQDEGTRLADGGVVSRSGWAWVDKGETYSGARGGRSRGGGGGVSFYIGTIVSPDPRATAQQLRQLTGSYGIGLRTDPLVGDE